jgi:dTDP-4-amino-4,6-dideoxygalactose transaminase
MAIGRAFWQAMSLPRRKADWKFNRMATAEARTPIAFVEEKRLDFEKVGRLLAESAAANHWTNFGPVWHRLKKHIETALGLPPQRCAIPSASGTHALYAAAALACRSAPRRWVTSSYGFKATAIGPFERAEILDCDRTGLIDLTGVDQKRYDGIVATNPFGLFGELDPLIAFARRTGKALIIDNAAAFGGFDRSDHDGIFECLSFHHTKPYGFGEGGCLIVDRALEADAKNAMDFGYRWSWPGGREALSNGKLSDPAAAFILCRQQSDHVWAARYREQFQRILNIGESLGFTLLGERERVGPGAHGNVPLLSPIPVPVDRIENDKLTLQKYYRPLDGGVVSQDLYARMINVPCHPGVAALTDREIEELLATIRSRARAA